MIIYCFPTKISYNLKLSTPTPMIQKISILKVALSFCENKCLIIRDRRVAFYYKQYRYISRWTLILERVNVWNITVFVWRLTLKQKARVRFPKYTWNVKSIFNTTIIIIARKTSVRKSEFNCRFPILRIFL